MILDKFLNESTQLDGNDELLVEASNEGFTHEDGGMARAISLAESEITKLEMANLVAEAKAVQLIVKGREESLSESAIMEQVYSLQENVATNAWGKIKEIAKKLWARIQSIIESVVNWFTKNFNKSEFLTRAKSQLQTYNNFTGLEFEGYEYNYEAVDALSAFTSIQTKIKENLDDLTKPITDKAVLTDAKDKLEQTKTATFKDELAGLVVSGADVSNLKSKVMEKMRGGTSKSKLSFDKNKAIADVEGAKAAKNKINGIRTKAQTAFNKAIAGMEDDEKKAKAAQKENKNEFTTFRVSALSHKSSLLNTALTLSSYVTQCALDVIKEETSQSLNHISAALKVAKKNSKGGSETKTQTNTQTKASESADFLGQILQEL